MHQETSRVIVPAGIKHAIYSNTTMCGKNFDSSTMLAAKTWRLKTCKNMKAYKWIEGLDRVGRLV